MLYFLLRVAERSGRSASSSTMSDILKGPLTISSLSRLNSTAMGTPSPPSLLMMSEARVWEDERPATEVWSEFQELKRKSMGVSESALLKDLLFTLQGVDGNMVRLDERTSKYTISGRTGGSVGPAVRDLIAKIGECGLLHGAIRREISSSAWQTAGAIRQSLARAAEVELRDYLRVVASYEMALTGAAVSDDNGGMTLRRAVRWFGEIQIKLRFLKNILDELRTQPSAGALLSALHQLCSHGDSLMAAMAERMMGEAMDPFLRTLREFIQYGQLYDPCGDFFVAIGSAMTSSSGSSTTTIAGAYSLAVGRIPERLLSEEMARKVLLTGKTRSFLASLSSSMQVDDDGEVYENATNALDPSAMEAEFKDAMDDEVASSAIITSLSSLVLGDQLSGMRGLIQREHHLACRQLARVLKEQYNLRRHFETIRDFIHFSRGDFATLLMEAVGGLLGKPAGSLFRHALVSCLDQALLALPVASAEVVRDLRERMDVRLHESSNPKLTGWDVFTLDYKVDFPINVIITGPAMEQHVRLSHFLWSLRRVSFGLTGCWARILSLQKMAPRELHVDLKRLQMFIQEGLAVARQVNIYAGNVVHGCWGRFMKQLEESTTEATSLDDLMAGHETLIRELSSKLCIYSSGALKMRLAAVLGSLLRTEAAVRGYERYVALYQEHHHRTINGGRPSRHSLGASNEDESILDTFATGSLRLLAEQRAVFQNVSRAFQTELDELLLQMQKSEIAHVEIASLMMVLDYGGYHKRRNGFDQRKYCSATR